MSVIDLKSLIKDLCKEAESSLSTNLDKAIKLTDEAYLKSLEINDDEGISKSMFLYGIIKFKMREFSAANEYFESCLNLSTKNAYHELKSRTMKYLGDLRLEVNDYETALEYYLSCLEIISSALYSYEEKGEILFSLGIIYKELEQFNIALEYFEEAINLSLSKKKNATLSKLYSHMSECYLYEGQIKEAGHYVHLAIQKAAEEDSDFNFGYAYMVYAKYLFETADFDEAKIFFEKSIKKFSDINYMDYLLDVMAEYGIMLYKNNHFLEAKNILAETSLILLNNKSLKVELKVYLYLAMIYEKTNEPQKALEYFKRFHEIKTVNDETWKTIKIKNIINKYEYLRTDIKVKELTNTNENLVALSKLGRKITSTLNHIEIIDKISQSIFELIKCDSFGIGFMNKDKILDYIIVHGDSQKSIAIDTKKKNLYIKYLLENGQENIDNDFINTRFKRNYDFSYIGIDYTESLMSCPLIFEKQIIGIFVVYSSSRDAFKENDMEILKILSAYTSIAINNCMQSQALIESNKKLKELTERDGLTKVFNRYSLNINANRIMNRAMKYDKPLSVIMIDVDFFKEYNDHYGHLAGDTCLIHVSQVLKNICAKEKSYIYRYGGDEFLIIVLNKDEVEVENMAQNMRTSIMELNIEHVFSKCSDCVTLTVGVATIFSRVEDYLEIFALADKALYIAKNRGRNNVKQLIMRNHEI